MNLNPVIFMANRVVKTLVPATFKIFLFFEKILFELLLWPHKIVCLQGEF
jgi:hypothetical protein